MQRFCGALVLLSVACTQAPIAPECSATVSCREGLLCRGGVCSPCVERTEDALCGAGMLCVGGRCAAADCHGDGDCRAPNAPFCKAGKCAACAEPGDDVRCGPGRLCLGGACVSGDCRTTEECRAGEVCADHRCSAQCVVSDDCKDPVKRFCRASRCTACRDGIDDALCGPGNACVNGVCTAGACHSSADCKVAPALFCKGNVCAGCNDPGDDGLCGAGALCIEAQCTPGDCRATVDCPRGSVCLEHHCSAECAIDEDCTDATREFCRAGRCLACRDGLDDALCGPGRACLAGVCTAGACHRDADCSDAPGLFCKQNACEPCTDTVDDDRCGPGRLCLQGSCQAADCRVGADCPRGTICERNRCVAECTVDIDCKDAGAPFCRNDRCVPCRDLLDDPLCGPGKVCYSGRCVTGTCHLDSDCTSDPDRFCHAAICGPCVDRTDDARCGVGNICALSACRPGSCHATSDCSSGLVCHDYACQTCADRVDNRVCPSAGQVCLDGVCATGRCHDSSECTAAPKGLCDPVAHTCVASRPPTLPYKLIVTVDADGKAALNNPHAWVRIDFTPLLAGLGKAGKTVDAASLRVYDESTGGWGEVPSAVLRHYATANDVYLWFWARGQFGKATKRAYSVYFTTTDQPGIQAIYDVAPPPDLVMGYRGQAWAWRGDYQGQITERQGFSVLNGGDHNTLAIGDYDGDGDLDYVLCSRDDWNVFFVQNLGGEDSFQTFDTPRVIGRSVEGGDSNCMGAVAGDFNEDGFLDAVVERNWADPRKSILLLGRGDGTFEKRQLLQSGDEPRELDVGDFDGDGHLDITQALLNNPNWYIYWGDGTGRFSAAQTVGTFNSDNLDYYAHASGNFSATTAAPSASLDIIVGGAHQGHLNTARREFQNRGGRRPFTDKGYWPYVNVCPGRGNVHGFLKALDFDHDGFDDLLGYIHCDGDGNQYGAYYWHRQPSTAWQFDDGVRISHPTDWLGHGTAVPSLGHQLLYKVVAAASATSGAGCTATSCGQCGSATDCASGQVCLWATCGRCQSNAACGSTSVCVEGRCQPCVSGVQCGNGRACLSGSCAACRGTPDCDTGWECTSGVCSAPIGLVESAPALSCRDVATIAPTAPNGLYWIKPPGQAAAFQAYCDVANGGWTLVVRAANQGQNGLNTTGEFGGVVLPGGGSAKISHARIQALVNASTLENPVKMQFPSTSVERYVWRQCSWTSPGNRNKCASWASTPTATTHTTHCGNPENPDLNNGNGGEWPSSAVSWPFQDGTCQLNGSFATSPNCCGGGNGDAWANAGAWSAKTGLSSNGRFVVNIWVR